MFVSCGPEQRRRASPAPAAPSAWAAGSVHGADDILGARVEQEIREGSVSRGALLLVSPGLAARSYEILAELRDPNRRPPAPLEPVPREVLDYAPARPVDLDFNAFVACLRSAPSAAPWAATGGQKGES